MITAGWILWGLVLVLQNMAFTWVSRARNSGSYPYHALASAASNGIWILVMFFVVNEIINVESTEQKLWVCLFYTVCTTTGAVLMHWLSINYFEKGKRQVGARPDAAKADL